MDVRFVNPFIASVRDVFTTMLKTDILFSKPFIREEDDRHADVYAFIGLSGEAVGCVAMCFPMATAINAASKFAGTSLTKDHPDFADALGELANMVAGSAKAKIDGLNISISLPRVIVGNQLAILDSKSAPTLALPCDSALGRFCTEVAMVIGKKGAATA